jgi:hypothetical protein
MFDDNNALDFTLQESVQEHGIVAEGYTSIRLSAGAEHIRMCEHPIATKHVATSDRYETKGTNAMKILLTQREVIDADRDSAGNFQGPARSFTRSRNESQADTSEVNRDDGSLGGRLRIC